MTANSTGITGSTKGFSGDAKYIPLRSWSQRFLVLPLSVQPSVILLTRAQFLEAFLYRQTYGLNSTFMSSPANDADYAKFLDLYKRGLIPLRVCRKCLALICQPSIILYRITCSFGAISGPL